MDTIEINRRIRSFNLSASTFAPFHGTVLHTMAVQRGYLDPEAIAPANADWSILSMPRFPREEIYGLQRVFVMYVKFPKDRWPEIRRAEALTPDGDAAWNRLREEFLDTYFQEPQIEIAKVNPKGEVGKDPKTPSPPADENARSETAF